MNDKAYIFKSLIVNCNIKMKLKYILRNILLIKLYFLKKIIFLKFERKMSYFFMIFYNFYVHMKNLSI